MILALRAKKRTTDTAIVSRWRSKCGEWAVDEIASNYRLPIVYLAIQILPNGSERIISRHRTKAAAEAAIHAIPQS